jgi:hypothetical protein
VVAAVTFNPAADELFWAEKGKGAFLNNERRLRVAARRNLDEALLATGIPFSGRPGHAQFLKELHQMSARVAGRAPFRARRRWTWPGSRPGGYDAYWERGVRLGHRGRAADDHRVRRHGHHGRRRGRPAASGRSCRQPELHPVVLERLRARPDPARWPLGGDLPSLTCAGGCSRCCSGCRRSPAAGRIRSASDPRGFIAALGRVNSWEARDELRGPTPGAAASRRPAPGLFLGC